MESVSKQEYMRVLSELDMLTNKFVALEHENQRLIGDLQHVSAEKAQQYEELSQRVHQLEATILSLREQASGAQNSPREPKISLPAKFDGTRSLFRGFLNQVRLVIQLHPNRYPTLRPFKTVDLPCPLLPPLIFLRIRLTIGNGSVWFGSKVSKPNRLEFLKLELN